MKNSRNQLPCHYLLIHCTHSLNILTGETEKLLHFATLLLLLMIFVTFLSVLNCTPAATAMIATLASR